MTSNGMPSPSPKNYFISPLLPNYYVHTCIMTLFLLLCFLSAFPTLKKKKKWLDVWKENFTSQVTSTNKCIHFHVDTIYYLYGHDKRCFWYLCYELCISQCNKNIVPTLSSRTLYSQSTTFGFKLMVHSVPLLKSNVFISYWRAQVSGPTAFLPWHGNVICYVYYYTLARLGSHCLLLLVVAPIDCPLAGYSLILSPPQRFQNVFANNTMLPFTVYSWIYWNYLTCQMSLRS